MLWALPLLNLATPLLWPPQAAPVDRAPELASWARLAPVAPEPQRVHYVRRYGELQVQATAGRRASPVYREPWSQAEVYWALSSYSQEPLPIPASIQERSVNLALIGATLAAEALLNETLARSEFLSGAQRASRTLTGPNLAFTQTPQGARLVANGPAPNRVPDQQSAALDQPELPGGPRPAGAGPSTRPRAKVRRPPPPSLRLGAGTALRTQDDQDLLAPVSLAWNGYLILHNMGLHDARLSVDLVQLQFPESGKRRSGFQAEWSLAWQLSVRQRIHPRWTLGAQVRSIDSGYLLREVGTSLSYTLLKEDPRWVLRAGTRYRPENPKRPSEARADLTLQWNGRWRAPSDPGRWPLGQQPGKAEAWWTPQPA